MDMAKMLVNHREIERENEMHMIDFVHGPVVDFKVTECADIWTHADGYKEVCFHNEED